MGENAIPGPQERIDMIRAAQKAIQKVLIDLCNQGITVTLVEVDTRNFANFAVEIYER